MMRVYLEDFDEWQEEQWPLEYDPDELYDEIVDEWLNGGNEFDPIEFDDES